MRIIKENILRSSSQSSFLTSIALNRTVPARHPESSCITTRKLENFTESHSDKAGCLGCRLSWDPIAIAANGYNRWQIAFIPSAESLRNIARFTSVIYSFVPVPAWQMNWILLYLSTWNSMKHQEAWHSPIKLCYLISGKQRETGQEIFDHLCIWAVWNQAVCIKLSVSKTRAINIRV